MTKAHNHTYYQKWLNDNRVKWNEYQKLYISAQRVALRKKQAEDAKKLVRDFNLAHGNLRVFKAGVIFWFVTESGLKKPYWVAKFLGYRLKDVKFIFRNWIKYEIYIDGKFYFDDPENEESNWMEFILITMVGAGELGRVKVEI